VGILDRQKNKAAAAPGADIAIVFSATATCIASCWLAVGDSAGRGSCKDCSFRCDVTAVLGRTIVTGGGVPLRVV